MSYSSYSDVCTCGHQKHWHWMTQSAIANNGGFACDACKRAPCERGKPQQSCGGFIPLAQHSVVPPASDAATIDSLVHFIQGLIAGQALAADLLLESHSAYWVRAFKHLAEQRETKHV